jgi:hypothetical protein
MATKKPSRTIKNKRYTFTRPKVFKLDPAIDKQAKIKRMERINGGVPGNNEIFTHDIVSLNVIPPNSDK